MGRWRHALGFFNILDTNLSYYYNELAIHYCVDFFFTLSQRMGEYSPLGYSKMLNTNVTEVSHENLTKVFFIYAEDEYGKHIW